MRRSENEVDGERTSNGVKRVTVKVGVKARFAQRENEGNSASFGKVGGKGVLGHRREGIDWR